MKQKTTRIWESTVKNLRLIYAITGERMVSIMDRLVVDELKRIQEGINDPGLPGELAGCETLP